MSEMMEKIIKDKFDNFEVAPSAGLFNAILAKRKRKKRIIWIWSAASILIVATGYLALVNYNTDSIVTNELTKQEAVIENAESPKNTEETTSLSTENNLFNQEVETPINTNRSLQNRVLDNATNNAVKEQSRSNSHFADITQRKKEVSVKNQNLAEKFLEIVNSEKNKDVKKAKFFVKDKELVVDAPRNIVKTQVPEIDSDNTPEAKDEELTENEKVANSPEDEDLGGYAPKLSKWSLMVSAGPGIGGRILNGNENAINARNIAESSKVSLAFDVNASYALTAFWNVQTGINYIQRNENFNHLVTSMEITSHQETKEIIIIHPVLGEITKEVEFTVMDTTYNNTTSSATNKFTSFSVPLSAERMFPIGKNFTILAKAGVQFGIAQSGSGLTINKENEVVSLSSIPFKQGGVNRITVGFGASYRINNRFSLLVYPQGNVALQSVYAKSAIIEQRDFGLYTHLGLKIDL